MFQRKHFDAGVKMPKKVKFDVLIITIPILNEELWFTEYREARKSDWESMALDRERFKRRIKEMNDTFKLTRAYRKIFPPQ